MLHASRGFLFFCLAACFPLAVSAEEPPLILGIFPRNNATDTVHMFSPLAKYLASQLGREVRLETSKDFPAFWKGVTGQRYDLVHYNQLHYIRSHAEFGYEAILMNEEDGASTIAAVIVVRKDRGIRRLQDLKGKKIIFGGDKTALMAYIVPTQLLRKAGLGGGDYIEVFAKNPPNALLGVYYRQADAAGVGDVVMKLPNVTRQADISELMVVAESEPIAHLPWAVKKTMVPALRKKIRSTLADLKKSPDGREILKKANLTGLVMTDDKDYEQIRNTVR